MENVLFQDPDSLEEVAILSEPPLLYWGPLVP
jgi:hypothetical protein